MSNKVKSALVLSAVFALCFIKPSAALAGDSIIVPVSASASTYYNINYGPQWLIDGSGLTGTGRAATHTNVNSTNLFWHSNGTAVSNQWVEFDLGAAYDVTNALIWQLAQSGLTARGVKAFTISVARYDHVFSTLSTTNLNIATGNANEPVQVVPLAAKEIRYVRFTILSNYGNQYVGLSEVRFEGAAAVIAPLIVPVAATASSTWAGTPGFVSPQYMIDGSGLTGAGRYASHTNANAAGLFWHSDTGVSVPSQWAEFDLGAAYRVTNALIWQLAQAGMINRGVQKFTISVADADHNFTTYSTNNLLNIATGLVNEPVQVVPMAANNVRYVRFNIETNWGASGIVGLSEVRFDGDPWVQTPRDLTWNGTSDNASWNKVAQNWLTNGIATAFATGDNVRFDDTAAEKNVTLSNNVAVGAITVDSASDYRISAGTVANNRIVSSGSLVKRGNGVLELGGGVSGTANSLHSFTNDITVSGGTLRVVSNGQNLKNATEGLLGNMQAARTIRVSTNATLNLAARYLGGRFDSIPVTALVVDHGTLSFSSTNICENVMGPLTLDSAKIECVNTNQSTYVALTGLTRIMGTSTIYFAQSGNAKTLYFLDPAGTEVCVSNITQDAAWDARVDWPIIDNITNGVLSQTSGFRKTGAGTLYLGNYGNTLSGNIIVSEGTLEVAAETGINQAYSVLGNPKISHKVQVQSGATLKIDLSNTFGTGYDSPLTELELVGGTLSLANGKSSVFGPLTLENATVAYNSGYGAYDWAMMIFSKSVTFKGNQPYVFNPAGVNANLASGLNEETEMNVWDITGSSAIDVSLNLPFINFGGITNSPPPSRFKKTGPGTLSLGAVNTSTGALRVVEGVLRIDGRWNAANSSVTAESGGYLGGTGLVARAVFNGGGFECTMSQTGQLTAATAVIGATGSVRILNPGGVPVTQLNVPFLAYTALTGSENLANWTVEVAGVPPTTNLRVKAANGKLVAGWSPKGTLIRVW